MASARIFRFGRRFLGRGLRIGFVASVGAVAGAFGGFAVAMKQSNGAIDYHGAQASLERLLMEMEIKLQGDMAKRQKELGPVALVLQTEEEKRQALQIARSRAYIEAFDLKMGGVMFLLASELLAIARGLGDETVPQEKLNALSSKALVAIASSEMLLAGLDSNPDASSFDVDKQGLEKFLNSMDALRIHWSFGIRPSLAGHPIRAESDDKLQWVTFNDPVYFGLRTDKPLSAEEIQELHASYKEKSPFEVSQIIKS